MTHVIRLQDARAARAMGIPLTTPFQHRKPSRIVARHWGALEKYTRLLEDVTERWLIKVAETGGAEDIKLWGLLNRRVQKLGKVFVEANSALNRIAGNPINTVGRYSDEQEVNFAKALEADPSLIVIASLLPRVRDYLNLWQEFINAVVECRPGDSLNVEHLFDAPKVFDEGAE